MRLLIMVLALVLVGGQATTVDLIREEPLDVRLDWLSLQADGAVVVTRSSPVRLGPRATTVPIVKSADSFLRFNYPGMSPRTVSATTIPSKGTFRAPDPLAGGELMLTVRNAQVVPVRARIVGPRVTTTRNIEGRSAVIAGVMPGEYVVTPIYMGDFAGSPIRVLVGHAQTAAAILDQQAAGAAHIRLERSLCAEHTGIAIFSTQGTRRKVHEMPPARCESGVGGLMPGKYEVHLPLARRGVRTAVFEIKSQRTTEVVVMEFPVVARGQVSLGHKSAAETEVSFRHLEPADGTSPSFSVSTGPDGTYEAGLNAAGLYLVRIRRGSMFEERRVRIATGYNRLDWKLEGGSITVKVREPNWRVVEMHLTGGARSRSARWKAGAAPQVTFDALPQGAYRLRVQVLGPERLEFQSDVNLRASPSGVTLILDRMGLR